MPRSLVKPWTLATRARSILLVILAGAGGAWADAGAARAEDAEEHSYLQSADGKKIYDDELTAVLKQKLGGAYQNLQVVVSACHSGGFAGEAAKGAGLLGNWSLATPRDKDHVCTENAYNKERMFGEDGLKIGEWYYQGWTAQWLKKLREDLKATATKLAEYAKEHDHRPDDPQFEFGGTGDKSTVRDGEKSNHALIWAAAVNDKFIENFASELYGSLRAAGYNDATIDYAYDTKAGQKVKGIDVDRDATKAKLETMLEDLRTLLDANPGKEKAFLFVRGHGNTEVRKAEKQPDPQPGQPGQGKDVPAGGETSLELGPAFAGRLFDEVVGDDPDVVRVAAPAVTLTTFSETAAGETFVFLDSVFVGSLTLLGSPTGGDYEVPIDDARLLELHLAGALDDLAVEVRFYPPGSFRIATEWDFELSHLPHYGIGLAGPAVAPAAVETILPCGDGAVEPSEACDPPGQAGGCAAGTVCDAECTACVPAPVAGARLQVRDDPLNPAKKRISLVAKDPGITLGGPGSADDPRSGGAILRLLNPASGETNTFELPASRWRAVGATVRAYRYSDPKLAEGPVSAALVRNGGVVKATVKGAGIGYTLDEPTQGALGVVVRTGDARRYCALFGGTLRYDEPGRFLAVGAAPPLSCPEIP